MMEQIIDTVKKINKIKLPKYIWMNIIVLTDLKFNYSLEIVKNLPDWEIYRGAIKAGNRYLIKQLILYRTICVFSIFRFGNLELIGMLKNFDTRTAFKGSCAGGHIDLAVKYYQPNYRYIGIVRASQYGQVNILRLLNCDESDLYTILFYGIEHLIISDYALENFELFDSHRTFAMIFHSKVGNFEYFKKFEKQNMMDESIYKNIVNSGNTEFILYISNNSHYLEKLIKSAILEKKKDVIDLILTENEININDLIEFYIKENDKVFFKYHVIKNN